MRILKRNKPKEKNSTKYEDLKRESPWPSTKPKKNYLEQKVKV